MSSFYSDTLLEHYHRPLHYGLGDEFDMEAQHSNPLCGDSMTVRLKLDGNTVTDVCFESRGCVVARAAGSMTADYIIGKARDFILGMDADGVIALIETPVTPGRIKCATLFLDAVKKTL